MNTALTNHNVDEQIVKAIATEAVNVSLNVAEDRASVLTLVPDDSFNKKLTLIEQAQDLSTAEKLAAMEQAENKRLTDMQQGAEIHKDLTRNRVWIILTIGAGLLLLVAPGGVKLLHDALKKSA